MVEITKDSREFLRAILIGDRRAADRILRQCLDRRNPAYVYEEVLCQAMCELGDMWARDEITIADEHLATATADAALSALYRDIDWPESRSSRIFIACPQGEHHVLGARILADLLALDGWDEMYFGANVPTDTLARKAAELHPEVVALSVTMRHHLASARETVAAIRDASPRTQILAGGRAFAGAADVRTVGLVDADIFTGPASNAVTKIRDWQ